MGDINIILKLRDHYNEYKTYRLRNMPFCTKMLILQGAHPLHWRVPLCFAIKTRN